MNLDLAKEKCVSESIGSHHSREESPVKSENTLSFSRSKLFVPIPVRPHCVDSERSANFAKMVQSSACPSSRLAHLKSVLQLSIINRKETKDTESPTRRDSECKDSVASTKSAHIDSAFTIYPSIEQPTPVRAKYVRYFGPTKRWNRTDDKNLFRIIREISQVEQVSLDEIVDCLTSNESSPYWAKIIPQLKSQVESWSESQTLEQVDKKGMKFFMKRVQKLNHMREISRREHKLIRKLLRSNKNDVEFSWDSILFHFPGKRLEDLQSYTVENFPKYFQTGDSSNIQWLLDEQLVQGTKDE